jgi:hypothetical protein
VLVAFDTEGVTQHFHGKQIASQEVSELGVAVLRPSEFKFRRNLLQFYKDNDIEAFTIRMRKRRYGPVVGMMTNRTQEEAGPRLEQFLTKIEGERILIGYDLQAEWIWIARKFPAISGLFTAWCNVQELVGHRYEPLTPHTHKLSEALRFFSMANALKAMSNYGWTQDNGMHGAAGDSVKLVAILSGLLCDTPLRDCEDARGQNVSVFCYLPLSWVTRVAGRRHAHTARVSATNGQYLPLRTPRQVEQKLMGQPGLIGVRVGSINETIPRGPFKRWWVSFSTEELLGKFVLEFHGSVLDDVELQVVIDVKVKRPRVRLPKLTDIVEDQSGLPELFRYVASVRVFRMVV